LSGEAVTGIPPGSTGDKTFYARWTPVDYSINYKLNGGSNAEGNPLVYTIESSIITFVSAVRTGYAFGGWYDNAGLSGEAVTGIPSGSTGNKTFYAKWTPGLSVQIYLRPIPEDPSLSNTSLFVDNEIQFFAGTGYQSWTWYWDGEVISGMNSDTYTLAANSKPEGIYELSVQVTTEAGKKLSARCRVTIEAH
jgi:uncharacterized repeat protein (TIGR02543 family)